MVEQNNTGGARADLENTLPEPVPQDAGINYQKLPTPSIVSLVVKRFSAVMSDQLRARQEIIPDLVKWCLLAGCVVQKKQTDGSLIRVTTIIGPGQSVDSGGQRLQSFANAIVPKLGS